MNGLVQSFSGSHAPALIVIHQYLFLVPKLRLGMPSSTLRVEQSIFLVPKLRLGMPSSTLRVEQSINTDGLKPLGLSLLLQRGALREGIPKRSLGTRKWWATIIGVRVRLIIYRNRQKDYQ